MSSRDLHSMIYTIGKNVEVLSNGLHISPYKYTSIDEQIKDCLRQLDVFISDLNRQAVLVVYFVDASEAETYHNFSNAIKQIHQSRYKSPYSIIAQPPVDGTKVNIEVYHCSAEVNPVFRSFEDTSYCVFYYEEEKFLIAGGLRSKTEKFDLPRQSNESFRLMKGILDKEEMDFSHIFRQWNYIESIVDKVYDSQRYQIFNDIRSLYYSDSDFIYGYPAATGIGTKTGGAIIDFLASTTNKVWPVKNPAQIDAHKYSGDVLANNELSEKFKKSTPKFERAKVVSQGESMLVYISGTAAIKGETSEAIGDAYNQTLLTIDNIERLVELENLRAQNIPINKQYSIVPVSFRVYIKLPDDVKKVQLAFESRFGLFKNVQYLIADICRPELLVEFEGTYRLKKM